MCNCDIEAENHFLLESLAACQGINSKLAMYFTVATALSNYLDQLCNLTESLTFPIIKNKTSFEQILLYQATWKNSFTSVLMIKKFWFARKAGYHGIKY